MRTEPQPLRSNPRATADWDPGTGDLFAGFGCRRRPRQITPVAVHTWSPDADGRMQSLLAYARRRSLVRGRIVNNDVQSRWIRQTDLTPPALRRYDPSRPRRLFGGVLRWCNIYLLSTLYSSFLNTQTRAGARRRPRRRAQPLQTVRLPFPFSSASLLIFRTDRFYLRFFRVRRDVTAVSSEKQEGRKVCVRERERETEWQKEWEWVRKRGGRKRERSRTPPHSSAHRPNPYDENKSGFFHPSPHVQCEKGLAIVRGPAEERLRSLIVSSVVPQ